MMLEKHEVCAGLFHGFYRGKWTTGTPLPTGSCCRGRRSDHLERRTRRQDRHGPDGRLRVYDYDEQIARDNASLDNFWLRDKSLADSDNLPPPAEIARQTIEDLEAALEQLRLIDADLAGDGKVESTA